MPVNTPLIPINEEKFGCVREREREAGSMHMHLWMDQTSDQHRVVNKMIQGCLFSFDLFKPALNCEEKMIEN